MGTYSKEQEVFIAKNYQKMTDVQIAFQLGKSESGIKRKRERMGFYKSEILLVNSRQKVKLSTKAYAYELRCSGRTFSWIARFINHPKQSIIRWCKQFEYQEALNPIVLVIESKMNY